MMTKSNLQKLKDQVEQIESGISSNKPSLLARGIRYLSMRDHSEIELRRKLQPHAQDEVELCQVIEKLKSKHFLSNERFSENFVQKKSQTFGMHRMVHELRKHELGPEIISKQLSLLKQSEAERAYAVWSKKFGSLTNDPKTLAKQIRFMASRGFDQEIIYKIIKGKTLDDSE